MTPTILTWTGKAVNVNKWHVVRKGRIYPSREYEEFIDSLSWTFKAGCQEKFSKMGIKIKSKIGKTADHQNLLKPICDALERAGIIDNDRSIGKILLLEPTRHKRGQPDEITVEIIGGWPVEGDYNTIITKEAE